MEPSCSYLCMTGGPQTAGFSLDLRRSFFTARTVRQQIILPREAVQSVCTLGGFSRPNWINPQAMWSEAYLALHRGLSQRPPDPSHLSYSVILITSPSIPLNIMAALHSSLHFSHHPKLTATTQTPNLKQKNAQASKLQDPCNILIFLGDEP